MDSYLLQKQYNQTSYINNDIYIQLLRKKIHICNVNNYGSLYRNLTSDHQSHGSLLNNPYFYRNISKKGTLFVIFNKL